MWAWNKVALLQKVLRETPPERAPWILYIQPDTIVDDIAFTFPFEMYQDKHWVSVGKAESVLNGWASGGCLSRHLPDGRHLLGTPDLPSSAHRNASSCFKRGEGLCQRCRTLYIRKVLRWDW